MYCQAGVAIPPVILLLGAKWVPESPKWLVQHNRKADARNVLLSLRVAGADVDTELNEMAAESRRSEDDSEVTWGELFQCKQAVTIGCGLMICASSTGINSVMFYSSTIFGFAGFDQPILGMFASIRK